MIQQACTIRETVIIWEYHNFLLWYRKRGAEAGRSSAPVFFFLGESRHGALDHEIVDGDGREGLGNGDVVHELGHDAGDQEQDAQDDQAYF